jgi:hypothetical protein
MNDTCVTPASCTSDFYANACPEVDKNRMERPQLVQTGARFPTICEFETMTLALDNAITNKGAGHNSVARVIADNANDDALQPDMPDQSVVAFGSRLISQGKANQRVITEQFPWVVFQNVAVSTVSDDVQTSQSDVTRAPAMRENDPAEDASENADGKFVDSVIFGDLELNYRTVPVFFAGFLSPHNESDIDLLINAGLSIVMEKPNASHILGLGLLLPFDYVQPPDLGGVVPGDESWTFFVPGAYPLNGEGGTEFSDEYRIFFGIRLDF